MLSKSQFKYIGAIRTPHESSTKVLPKDVYPPDGKFQDGLNYGGKPFTIDIERNEFVMVSRYMRTVRLKMVEPGLAVNNNPDSLPVAPYVDGMFHDLSNNTWNQINASEDWSGVGPGGLLIKGNKIYCMATTYYDANNGQRRSILAADWPINSLIPSNPTPWKTVGSPFTDNGVTSNPEFMQGYVAGPMAHIPERFQFDLNGDVLSFQSALPIITRQFAGPGAITYWLNDVLTKPAVPANFLYGYPTSHMMPGHPWDNPNPDEYYNQATEINGVAIIGDNIVYIGSHGYGDPCYGGGTSKPELHETSSGDGGVYCYDPAGGNKGTHAYPYRLQAWIKPVQYLIDVKKGLKKPWEELPSIFTIEGFPYFPHPYYPSSGGIPKPDVNGIGYHPALKRLYISLKGQDGYGWEPGPVIHVFEVSDIANEPIPPIVIPVEDTTALKAEITRLNTEIDNLVMALNGTNTKNLQLTEKLASLKTDILTLQTRMKANKSLPVWLVTMVKNLVIKVSS